MSSGMSGGAPVRELPLRVVPPATLLAWLRRSLGGKGSLHLIERHARAYRHLWLVLVSGLAEPLFYLLSLGVGSGSWSARSSGRTATRSATPRSWGRPCWPPRP